jgi:serine/threonine protein kinase
MNQLSSTKMQDSQNAGLPEDQDGYKFVLKFNPAGLYNEGIFLVVDKTTNKQAVCKFSQSAFNSSYEAEMIKKLEGHPNIVQLFKHSPPNKLYLEYCDGGSMDDIIRRYREAEVPIPEAFIWEVFVAMIRAIGYMHLGIAVDDPTLTPVKGWIPIIHRDIQTGNVLLSSSQSSGSSYPRVILADFGASATSIHANEKADYFGVCSVIRKMWHVNSMAKTPAIYSSRLMMFVDKTAGVVNTFGGSTNNFMKLILWAKEVEVKKLVAEPLLN